MFFFYQFVDSDIPKKCIENPVGIMSTEYRKPDQVIHPYQYGHLESKATCLWLTGLPKLVPTKIAPEELRKQAFYNLPANKDRGKIKSRTFTGIAEAMAVQWGGDIR
jgi:hypothetical protein